MLRKIEHLGIAVNSIEDSIKTFETLLGTACYKIEDVQSEGVKTAFLKIGESKIELLEATNPDSPIAKFIEKKGGGIHHIAFDVEDIEVEITRLTERGI
jgi:methylmalonyl-CoA/ethylmalonyl-CoA epimerase